ncbi:hypothetical protein ACTNDP_21955 [Paenibacillus barengoltzii]|uniref:hypothetical protein n=1 Tax=Paenibacillus barengoltzii TaxID=343517 RepID=UPI003F8B2C8C
MQIQFAADPATGFADIDKLDLRRFQGQRLPVNRHNFERWRRSVDSENNEKAQFF